MTELGRFKIENWVSKGSYGFVLNARDEKLNQVVIKAMLINDFTTNALECYNIIKLNPNPGIIIPLEQFDLSFNDVVYKAVVYKKIEGQSFYSIIYRCNSFNKNLIAIRLINAVKQIHSMGIVHNDLKPGNIIIDNNCNPTIIDFSISTYGSNKAKNYSAVGTPEYMAPEAFFQIRNKSSDIWSLGVIIYEMFEKKLPFGSRLNGISTENIRQNVFLNEIKFKHTPGHLRQFINGCLEKRINKRIRL